MMKPLKKYGIQKNPMMFSRHWGFSTGPAVVLGGNVGFGGTFGLNIDSRVMVAISNIIS